MQKTHTRWGALTLAAGFILMQLMVHGFLPLVGIARQEALAALGFIPSAFLEFSQPQAMVSSLLLHSGWLQVFFSVLILSVAGRLLEREIGSLRLLLLFFTTSFMSLFPVLIIRSDSYDIYFGAIGGIWGLLAVATLFYTRTHIRFLFFNVSLPLLTGGLWLGSLAFLPWDDIFENGSWLILPAGGLAGVVYARLALGLHVGGKMQSDPKIWNLKVTHPGPSDNSILASMQVQNNLHSDDPDHTTESRPVSSQLKTKIKDLDPFAKPGLKTPVVPDSRAVPEVGSGSESMSHYKTGSQNKAAPDRNNSLIETGKINASQESENAKLHSPGQDVTTVPETSDKGKKLLFNTKTGEFYYK